MSPKEKAKLYWGGCGSDHGHIVVLPSSKFASAEQISMSASSINVIINTGFMIFRGMAVEEQSQININF